MFLLVRARGFEVFKSFWCILFSSSIYLFSFCNTLFSLASLPGPNTGSKCIPMLARHFATIVARYCTVSYIREWNAKVSKSETYIFLYHLPILIYIFILFLISSFFENNTHVFVFLLFCLFWILPECLPVFSTLLFITLF